MIKVFTFVLAFAFVQSLLKMSAIVSTSASTFASHSSKSTISTKATIIPKDVTEFIKYDIPQNVYLEFEMYSINWQVAIFPATFNGICGMLDCYEMATHEIHIDNTYCKDPVTIDSYYTDNRVGWIVYDFDTSSKCTNLRDCDEAIIYLIRDKSLYLLTPTVYTISDEGELVPINISLTIASML